MSRRERDSAAISRPYFKHVLYLVEKAAGKARVSFSVKHYWK